MNTEFIALIAGFGACIVTSVLMAVLVGLLVRPAVNEEDKLMDSNKVKKRDYSYCATTFNLDIAETDEFNNIVKALESKDEKPSLIVLDTLTNVKDSCSQHCKT